MPEYSFRAPREYTGYECTKIRRNNESPLQYMHTYSPSRRHNRVRKLPLTREQPCARKSHQQPLRTSAAATALAAILTAAGSEGGHHQPLLASSLLRQRQRQQPVHARRHRVLTTAFLRRRAQQREEVAGAGAADGAAAHAVLVAVQGSREVAYARLALGGGRGWRLSFVLLAPVEEGGVRSSRDLTEI